MIKIHNIKRSLGNFVAISRGRILGRTHVPHPRKQIFIETSGLCNLTCRFCAYDKMPKGSLMGNQLFIDAVDQAARLGFTEIVMTPMLGDLFSDPKIYEKLDILESDERIQSVVFYTNLIMARSRDIHRLGQYSKLRQFLVSIYGIDDESFELTTRKPARQLEKFCDNLEHLLAVYRQTPFPDGLNFSLRTVAMDGDPLARNTKVTRLISEFLKLDGCRLSVGGEYDSWGGIITQDDVAPLGIDITRGELIYMHGACTKLFAEVQIGHDGKVHACACRDTTGTLIIGDIKETPLGDILSLGNDTYRKIIDDQMRGQFLKNCRSCSSYRSIHDHRSADARANLIDLETARKLIS